MVDKWFLDTRHPLRSSLLSLIIPYQQIRLLFVRDSIFIDYYIKPYQDTLYQINYCHPPIIYITVYYTFHQYHTLFQFIIHYPIRISDKITDC